MANNINVNMSLNFTITNNNQSSFERTEGSSAERSRTRKSRKIVGQRNHAALKSSESRASQGGSAGALAPFAAHLANRPSRRNIKHISSGTTAGKEGAKLAQEEKRKSSREQLAVSDLLNKKRNFDEKVARSKEGLAVVNLSQPKVLDR